MTVNRSLDDARKGAPGKPGKDKGEEPWTAEEVKRSRLSWAAAFTGPTARLFIQKWAIGGLLLLVLFLELRMWRVEGVLKGFKPIIVRVNDVGRSEVVRLDTDFVPEEPEIRNQLQSLVIRMFARNGFTLPEAIELNGSYLLGEAYRLWVKQAKEDLKVVAGQQGLKRVRILYMQIDRVASAKTPAGTRATVRFATDDLTENGAVTPNSAKGYEITMDFRVGDWVKTEDEEIRQKWVVRNPLGLRLMRYQVQQYVGSDVNLSDSVTPVLLHGTTASYAPGTAPDVNTAQTDQATQGLPLQSAIPVPAQAGAVPVNNPKPATPGK